MATSEKLRIFKVVLIGNSNVGKTSTFIRLNGKDFGSPAPVGIDFIKRDYQVQSGGSVSVSMNINVNLSHGRGKHLNKQPS